MKYLAVKDDVVVDGLVSKIVECHEMLDAIRIRKKMDFNVETLKTALGLSRTVADKFITELQTAGIIKKVEKRRQIIGNVAFFLGISVGSQHTRVHVLDLNFDSISRNTIKKYPCLAKVETLGELLKEESDNYGICFKTPTDGETNAFNQVRDLVSSIIAAFLNQAEKGFPLAGVGIAVTGPVDYVQAEWRSAPERFTKVQNISLRELIGYRNFEKAQHLGVFWALDNNAKTAMISEYQYLLEQYKGDFDEDIALIYLGSGIGSSAVLGKKLLRGCHNLSGELGSLPTLPAYIKDESGKLQPSNLRGTIDDWVRSPDRAKDPNFYPYILTYLCNAINCVLGIERVILVGHSVRQHENIIPALLENRMEYTIASTQHYCKPQSGRCESGTAAIGAAIEAYMCMCHFNSALPEERTNLAKDIRWL